MESLFCIMLDMFGLKVYLYIKGYMQARPVGPSNLLVLLQDRMHCRAGMWQAVQCIYLCMRRDCIQDSWRGWVSPSCRSTLCTATMLGKLGSVSTVWDSERLSAKPMLSFQPTWMPGLQVVGSFGLRHAEEQHWWVGCTPMHVSGFLVHYIILMILQLTTTERPSAARVPSWLVDH